MFADTWQLVHDNENALNRNASVAFMAFNIRLVKARVRNG